MGPLAFLFYQMNITSAQDPPYFPGPFSINEQGWLQAPLQGLKGQAQKVSMTWDLCISMDSCYKHEAPSSKKKKEEERKSELDRTEPPPSEKLFAVRFLN